MLKLPVYLYNNNFTVTLDLDENRGVNQVMYQRNLIIQKSLKNDIQIQFKNSDQKPVPVNSMTMVFNMFDTINNRQLISKNLKVIDDGVTTSTRGLAILSITESDSMDLNTSFYNYSVTVLDQDNSYVPAYSNTYYGIQGTIEVRDDVRPVLLPSTDINSFWVYRNTDPGVQRYEFYSGYYNAHAVFKSNEAVHTAAIYMTNFSGRVSVQGSLNNSPPSPGSADGVMPSIRDIQSTAGMDQFANISELEYDNFTGIDYITWSGNFTYTQFKWIPNSKNINGAIINYAEPGNPINPNFNTGKAYYPYGSVDKILYRS